MAWRISQKSGPTVLACPFDRMNIFTSRTFCQPINTIESSELSLEWVRKTVHVPRPEGFKTKPLRKSGMGWWTTLDNNQTARSCPALTQEGYIQQPRCKCQEAALLCHKAFYEVRKEPRGTFRASFFSRCHDTSSHLLQGLSLSYTPTKAAELE